MSYSQISFQCVGLPSFLTHPFSQMSTHWFPCHLWLDNMFKSFQQVCTETVGLHQALFFQGIKPKCHWITADRWTHENPPRCKGTPFQHRDILACCTAWHPGVHKKASLKSGASFTCFKPQTFWFLGCSSISVKIWCSISKQKSLANHPLELNTPVNTSWFYVGLKYPRRIHSKIKPARYMRRSQRGQEHL